MFGAPFFPILVWVVAATSSYNEDHPLVFAAFAALTVLLATFRSTASLQVIRGCNSRICLKVQRISTALGFVTWGVFTAVSLHFYQSEWPSSFMLLASAASAGGAATSLAPDRLVATISLCAITLPTGLYAACMGGPQAISLASGCFLYLAFTLSMVRMNWTSYRGEVEGREAQKQRQRAEDLARTRSEFLAHMSHEIRTPMHAVLGMVELLLHTDLTEQQREYSDLAHSSALRLLAILNSILDLSKIEAGKMPLERIRFDLERLVASCCRPTERRARDKGLEFRWSVAEAARRYYVGDPVRIGQILVNLADNAVKFTESGSVEVAVSAAGLGGEQDRVEFVVTDTGIGIDEAARASLFEAFTQADASTTRIYGGTGLGLSIASHLAKLMGGALSVEGEPGTGSTFVLDLPLECAEEPAEDRSPAACPLPPADGTGGHVLVAEDNEVNQHLAVRLLEKLGFTADVVADGEGAVEAAAATKYDAILMDQRMPRLDGMEAARQIRAAEPPGEHVPIIALTASAMAEDRQRFLDAGMDDYLPKPVSIMNLLQALTALTKPAAARQDTEERGAGGPVVDPNGRL